MSEQSRVMKKPFRLCRTLSFTHGVAMGFYELARWANADLRVDFGE